MGRSGEAGKAWWASLTPEEQEARKEVGRVAGIAGRKFGEAGREPGIKANRRWWNGLTSEQREEHVERARKGTRRWWRRKWKPPSPYGLRGQIFRRDGLCCGVCGAEGHLALHHIDYNAKNDDPDNLLSLCWSCHGRMTCREPSRRQGWKRRCRAVLSARRESGELVIA